MKSAATMEKEATGLLIPILYSLGATAIAVLGGVTKLFQDNPDNTKPIGRRDWVRYITSALLAGIVLVIIVYHHHGASPLLFAVAGVAGFGSVQLLGFLVEILKSVIKRFYNHNS